jgi:hypothetical protein
VSGESFEGSPWGQRCEENARSRRRVPRLLSIGGIALSFGAAAAFAGGVVGPGVDRIEGGLAEGAVAELRDSHRAAVRRARSARKLLGVRRRKLEKIAECESHGNPRSVSSDGTHRGKYQFDRRTWKSNGGTGDPAKASELEQDLRAAALYRAAGTNPWPNCG